MLDIRYVAGAILASVIIVIAALRLFGGGETSLAAAGGSKPRLQTTIIQKQPILTPATPQAASPQPVSLPTARENTAISGNSQAAETTGSIGSSPAPAPRPAAKARSREAPKAQIVISDPLPH